MQPSNPSIPAPVASALKAWARSRKIAAFLLLDSVVAVERVTLRCDRARLRGRLRRVEVAHQPTASRSRKLDPLPDPASISPWEVTPSALREESSRLCLCPSCSGEKRGLCPNCGGTAEVGCDRCSGAGSVFSPRSGRLVGCRSCRRTGRRKCRCRNGVVRCPECQGRGKVEAWLRIVESPFALVRASPANPLSAAFDDFAVAGSFDRPRDRLPVRPVHSWSGDNPAEAPPEAEARLVELGTEAARLDPRTTRIDGTDFQGFEAPAYRVSYRYRGTAGDLWIGAWDDRVLEPDREPWSAGTERLRWLRGMGAMLGMVAAIFYLAGHPYFLMQPASLGGMAAGGAAGVALAGGLAGAGLPRGRRRARRLGTVAAAFLLSVLTLLAFAEASRPSLAKALERLENDRTSAALATLQACRDLGIEPQAAAELHDRILEQHVLDAEDIAGAWKGVEAPFISPAARDRAERHALVLSARRAAELQAQGAFLNSAQILSKVPLSLRGAEEIRPYFLALMQYRLLQCAEPADLACAQRARSQSPSIKLDEEEQARLHQAVFQTLKPGIDQAWKEMRSFQEIERRLEACRRLSTATELVERYAPMQAEALPIRSDPLAFRCADLVRAKLRHEQARREAVVRRERAARASWASAPLLCRDGTLSPTCVCDQASRRGCCSHHGGVAGCSAP